SFGVSRPAVTGRAGATERPPAALDLVADPQGSPPVSRSGQQGPEPAAIDVENSQQLRRGSGAQAGPVQQPWREVVSVQVGRGVPAVGGGDLPGRRAEREVAA